MTWMAFSLRETLLPKSSAFKQSLDMTKRDEPEKTDEGSLAARADKGWTDQRE